MSLPRIIPWIHFWLAVGIVWYVPTMSKATTGSQTTHVNLRSATGLLARSEAADGSCNCPSTFDFGLECDPVSCQWLLSNGYWVGLAPEGNNTVVVGLCPTDYCYVNNSGRYVHLPPNVSEFDQRVCGRLHRTGILCGRCVEGYAPAINSDTFECVSCSESDERVNWIYYLLSVFLPLFILFLVIIIFKVRLTTGPANAFILYAQVVATTFDLSADGQVPLNSIYEQSDQLLNVYRVPYNVFNLKFIANVLPPFCLGTSLNALDVISLNYLVAIFPLIMILFIVMVIKLKAYSEKFFHLKWQFLQRFRRSGWRISDSLVHAFAAFMLLSYTRLCLTSAYLVGLQPLLDENGEQVGAARLYFAGQFTSYDRTYIIHYGIPAYLIFATFIAIPPLLLLEYPVKWLERVIFKLTFLKRIYPADKVNILLDTFQGCFRDNRRFFAGLYFIFRLALYCSYMLTDTWLLQYVIQQILVTLYILLIAILRPYKKKFLNYVDMLIFGNMAVLNILSLYLIEFNVATPHS